MPSIKTALDKISLATITFKEKTLGSVLSIFKSSQSSQLIAQLQLLQVEVRDEFAASQDLKRHQIGHPLHRFKANNLASAILKVEQSLAVINRSYPDGVEQLYDTYYLTSEPIPAYGKDGGVKGTARPLLQEIYTEIGEIYAELTFREAVWDTQFPLTKLLVSKILGRNGWRGGWVFSDFSEENPVCRWVEMKSQDSRSELRRGRILSCEVPQISIESII